ncbi:MAG TPA: ubiquinol-cytochrome c reductase iron-sulfur subunit, partial [Xanthobacteraceae bacterium]|nr:ubiquinol-cytochrome c reductase iron-sulfur subunit [Xanthobacteraceae bacterium]
MASTATPASTGGHGPEATRRDFLFIATATVGAVGAAATLVPLIDQMNPDASTLAAGGPVDLDVSKIEENSQVMIRWRERPIFVFHRSKQTLDSMQSQQMVSLLSDPDSAQPQQPPYANNWHRSLKPEYGILVGICTHLGCIPLFYPTPSAT